METTYERETNMVAFAAETPNGATYQDVERLLHKMTWDAVRRYGGDRDDYLSAANEAYVAAYQGWDPSRGTQFTTYLVHCVLHAFADLREDEGRWHGRHRSPDEERGLDGVPQSEATGIDRVLADLSEDARTVVALVVESPGELARLLRCRNPLRARRALWGHLKELGWTMGRVVSSFDEIRESLT